MDTKWKSKIILLVGFVLFAFGISGVVSVLYLNEDYSTRGYFQSAKFERHLKQLARYVYAFEIAYQDKEAVLSGLKVSRDEIADYRGRYGDLTHQLSDLEHEYAPRIREAQSNGDPETAEWYMKERDKKREEVVRLFTDDAYVEALLLEQKASKVEAYYIALEAQRPNYEAYRDSFVYELKNTATRRIYTNLPAGGVASASELQASPNLHHIRTFPVNNQTYWQIGHQSIVSGNHWEVEMLLRADANPLYEGVIGVSKQLPNHSFLMIEYNRYKDERMLYWIYVVLAVAALLLSLVLEKKYSFLRKLAPEQGRKYYQHIPLDGAILLLFFSSMLTLLVIFERAYLIFSKQPLLSMLEMLVYHLAVISIFIGATFMQGAYMYARIKHSSGLRRDWEKSVAARISAALKQAFLNRKVGTQVFLLMTIVFMFGLNMGLIFVDELFLGAFIPAALFVGLPLFIVIVKRIGYFNRIIRQAGALAKGMDAPDLKIKGRSVLAGLAHHLNQLKHGVNSSKKEQAKSERLKSELITNVSHDLRTPLTAIMTYTDLLKKPGLSEEDSASYIAIIDQKSKRLKTLIDDLFEASKMASGSVELVKEKVDVVQLLQQALAEYSDSIQNAPVQFRVLKPEHPVYAHVDGQKLWRVFDNLIGNILKYSLPNTRAYLQLAEEKGKVAITFKNVSEYELSENIDELVERFKRGDESRHTEGSGLGLAIAKTIIDLHDGTFDIEVDGDLFKVRITLAQYAKDLTN